MPRRSCHSLHWECGLKHPLPNRNSLRKSLPSLGVWIETVAGITQIVTGTCHSLHWECGLKHVSGAFTADGDSHSLHWECGLKPINKPHRPETVRVTPFIGSVD